MQMPLHIQSELTDFLKRLQSFPKTTALVFQNHCTRFRPLPFCLNDQRREEKSSTLIDQQRINPADVDYSDLNSLV